MAAIKLAFIGVANTAVAVRDSELPRNNSVTIELFELCTICGARYGIGYPNGANHEHFVPGESDDLPKKLTEILAKDHRYNREHKQYIDLDL